MPHFFKDLQTRYHIHLNDQQRAAVSHGTGPALVLSGPGSGKTTVITARTAFLIKEQGIAPEKILTVTFNKAAQLEMKNRFNRIFEEGSPKGPSFSTLHSFCYSVIKDYEKRQGKRLKLIEGESGEGSLSKQRVLKELYKELNETSVSEDQLEILMNEIGFVKNRMIRDFEGLGLQTKNFNALYKAYDAHKKQNLLMDFDDMLTYCYSILNRCPDILMSYRSKYRFFQVDEGQDLSKIQFEILKMLVAYGENNLFMVADDDQSIYGFRGAEPRYILEMESAFKGLSVYKLEQNYRSSRNIVDVSSRFVKSNKERYDKAHTTKNDEKYPPFIIRTKDESDQLSFIVGTLRDHMKKGKDARIAVLYRSNLSSIPLADALDRAHIPFRLRQNRIQFFQHWLIQDLAAFIKLSLNPFDTESFQRIYARMNRFISRSMVENAFKIHPELPSIEAVIKSNELKPFQVAKLYEVIKEFKRLSKMTPIKALQYIDQDFKYFGSIKDYCNHVGLSADYLYQLFGILKTLSLPCKTLNDFLLRLGELEKQFNNPYESSAHLNKNSITLSTLHSSKGLEYDVVFMMDLINREIPGENALKNAKEKDEVLLEEERRLFYVGMTRARTWLYLISPDSVNNQSVPRSTFVNEVASLIHKELSEQIGEGVLIHHKKYGSGVIAGMTHNNGRTMVEVDFKGKSRTLDLELCMKNGIIRLV